MSVYLCWQICLLFCLSANSYIVCKNSALEKNGARIYYGNHHSAASVKECAQELPESLRNRVSETYNNAFRKLGDENPDFIRVVTDLTSSKCEKIDVKMPRPDDIYTCSVGSKLVKATGGKFPLNFTYHLVNLFDGSNDGLVGEESFEWGEDHIFLVPEGQRGISHGDMIDLNCENIPGFDVREFYVVLVSKLKKRGL